MERAENINVNNPEVPRASNLAGEAQFRQELKRNTDEGRVETLRALRREIGEVDTEISRTIAQIEALKAKFQAGIKKAGGNENALAINAKLALEDESALLIHEAGLLAKKKELERRLNAA